MKAHGHQDRAYENNVRPTRRRVDCLDESLFREVRPEAVNIGNVKNQSSPLDTGIAVFEVQNRASVFCAERCER